MKSQLCLVLVLVASVAGDYTEAPPSVLLPAYERVSQEECTATGVPDPNAETASIENASFGTVESCTATTEEDACSYKVTASSDFQIEYFPGYKIVRNYFSNVTFVLHQCGTEQPNPVLFANEPAIVRYFEIPLTAVAVSDSTAAYYMEYLGLSDRVRYSSSQASSPCMALISDPEATGCGRVAKDDIALESYDAYLAFNAGPVTAIELSSDPDAPVTAEDVAAAAKKIGFSPTADPGVLNRAEWVAFLAAFFNREGLASQEFTKVKDAFTALVVAPTETAPVVAWLSYTGSFWLVNDAEGNPVMGDGISVSFAAYKQEFVTSAGGNNAEFAAWSAIANTKVAEGSSTAHFPFSLYNTTATDGNAAVLAAIKPLLTQVDIVIDETYYKTDPDGGPAAALMSNLGITDAGKAEYPFLANDAVWRSDKTAYSGDTWFGEAVARPDLVLSDMRKMLAPGTMEGDTIFFRNSAKLEPKLKLGSDLCTTTTCDSYAAQAPLLTSQEGGEEKVGNTAADRSTGLAMVSCTLLAVLAALL